MSSHQRKPVASQPVAATTQLDLEHYLSLVDAEGPAGAPDVFALSDPRAPGVKVRRDARATSVAAGALAMPRSGTQRMKVLGAIASAGSHGATDAELAERLNILLNSEQPRRLELVEGHWIEDSGDKRAFGGHGEGVVWRLTAQGRAEWARLHAQVA